jgi:penicillin amidase
MRTEPYAGARDAVHEELVDGFGTVRVLPVDPHADLDVIHGWVSEERARFWGMNGLSREQVLEIYVHLDSLDTHHAFLAVKDGEPAALFQTYEPRADRVSECYDVQDGDIGIHLLIGPAGPGVEPDARNTKAISLLTRQGFVPGPEIVLPEIDLPEVHLPEKPARLAFLTRERVLAKRA